MKVLIAEDDATKAEALVKFVCEQGVESQNVLTASTLAEFAGKLNQEIGLCIIDLRLPAYDGAQPDLNGIGILQVIDAKTGRKPLLVAISAFSDEFESVRNSFESHGCVLLDYHQPKIWQSALANFLIQASARSTRDFLIFVALQEERAPYSGFAEINPRVVQADGQPRLDITVGEAVGSVILLPRMGLVDAASTAAKFIDRYSPRLVAMSGICGGFPGKAALGQLLIADLAYEYQTGKWSDYGFLPEPYQVQISAAFHSELVELLGTEGILQLCEVGWKGERPSSMTDPKLAAFTSGSAVIASADHLERIAQHHRKVSGLDMEVYAIFRAAYLSNCSPDVLCAKVVVDLADGNKDDRIHGYGSFISARFVLHAIRQHLER